MSQLNSWLYSHLQNVEKSYWKLCYRATSYGWSSETFHRNCDDLGPTVTIIRAHGYTFGGYTDISWKCMFVDSLFLLQQSLKKIGVFRLLLQMLILQTKLLQL